MLLCDMLCANRNLYGIINDCAPFIVQQIAYCRLSVIYEIPALESLADLIFVVFCPVLL